MEYATAPRTILGDVVDGEAFVMGAGVTTNKKREPRLPPVTTAD